MLAALLGGCAVFGARSYAVTLPAEAPDSFPIEARLVDQAGVTTGLEFVPRIAPVEGLARGAVRVEPVAGRPNVVALTWVGGACDELVDMELRGGGSIEITLTTVTKGGGGCGLVDIPRTVVVVFEQSVDPGDVAFEVEP